MCNQNHASEDIYRKYHLKWTEFHFLQVNVLFKFIVTIIKLVATVIPFLTISYIKLIRLLFNFSDPMCCIIYMVNLIISF